VRSGKSQTSSDQSAGTARPASDSGGAWRPLAYALALCCFFALSFVVYRDDPVGNAQGFMQLSSAGTAGLRVWREQNCNTCHQLYGFGGYLGPDLTHVAQRVDEGTFRQIVRGGVGPMPAIALDDDSLSALYAFLSEMDASGQGHVATTQPSATWEQVFATLATRQPSLPGAAVFQENGCGQCHEPLRVGRTAAPDLTMAASRAHIATLEGVLRLGRGNMPAFGDLGDLAIEDLLDLLRALHEHRAALQPPPQPPPALDWFNYRRPAAEAQR